jgi:hypothetical protein
VIEVLPVWSIDDLEDFVVGLIHMDLVALLELYDYVMVVEQLALLQPELLDLNEMDKMVCDLHSLVLHMADLILACLLELCVDDCIRYRDWDPIQQQTYYRDTLGIAPFHCSISSRCSR